MRDRSKARADIIQIADGESVLAFSWRLSTASSPCLPLMVLDEVID
ncbi:MAG: hypothetical protein ACR2PC_16920 [Tsuneonella suprasediminis]